MPATWRTALLVLAALLALLAALLLLLVPPPDPAPDGQDDGLPTLDASGRDASGARLAGRAGASPSSSVLGVPPGGTPAAEDPLSSMGSPTLFDDPFRLRLLDAAGQGVAGVVLTIRPRGRRGPVVTAPHVHAWASGTSRTDAQGRVEVRAGNLAGGVVKVEFLRGPDDLLLPAPLRLPVTEEEVVIRLERGAGVAGRVLFDPARPVPEHVEIEARWVEAGTPRSRRARAEADGAFRVGGLPPDAMLDLLAFPQYPLPAAGFPGRGRPAVAPIVPAPTPMAAPSGGVWDVRAGTEGLVIRLDGPPTLDVVAVDDAGRTLTSAVRVTPAAPPPRAPSHVLVPVEGRLAIPALPPGPYRLEPLPPHLGALEIELPYPGEALVFPRVSRRVVAGRLVGSGDLSGFRVEVRSPSAEKPVVALADHAGDFSATVAGGPLSFRVTRFGDLRSGALRDVPESVREVEILLERGLELRGVVLDVNGAPASFEGWVRAEGPSGIETSPLVRGGRFVFASLPPGRYTLRVGGDGPTSEALLEGVEAGARDVTVRLGAPR